MNPNPLKLFRAFKLSWKNPFVGSTHFDAHPFRSTSWPTLSDVLQGIPWWIVSFHDLTSWGGWMCNYHFTHPDFTGSWKKCVSSISSLKYLLFLFFGESFYITFLYFTLSWPEPQHSSPWPCWFVHVELHGAEVFHLYDWQWWGSNIVDS